MHLQLGPSIRGSRYVISLRRSTGSGRIHYQGWLPQKDYQQEHRDRGARGQ
jgi:hypothetical protein